MHGNTNGKLNHKAYIEQILEPAVLLWLVRHEQFILEEDGDSGHGYSRGKNKRDNAVTKWKQ